VRQSFVWQAGGGIGRSTDQMIENDRKRTTQIWRKPVAALSTMADALDGMGIVLVLGLVTTMGAWAGPRKESAKGGGGRWWDFPGYSALLLDSSGDCGKHVKARKRSTAF